VCTIVHFHTIHETILGVLAALFTWYMLLTECGTRMNFRLVHNGPLLNKCLLVIVLKNVSRLTDYIRFLTLKVFFLAACSRLSVRGDDREGGRATSRSSHALFFDRRGHLPRASWNRLLI